MAVKGLCEWNKNGETCMAGEHFSPKAAVHEVQGKKLCGFHSPYDSQLADWEVELLDNLDPSQPVVDVTADHNSAMETDEDETYAMHAEWKLAQQVAYTITWDHGGYSHTLDIDSFITMILAAEALSIAQPVLVTNNNTWATRRFMNGSMLWTDANF
jgi:hypothetical protein